MKLYRTWEKCKQVIKMAYPRKKDESLQNTLSYIQNSFLLWCFQIWTLKHISLA